jgi:uncharacterized Rmd1/YagE family protein
MSTDKPKDDNHYRLYCYSFDDIIDLKAVRTRLSEYESRRSEGHCLSIKIADTQFLYVFQFGSVVLLNINEDKHSELLQEVGVVSTGTRVQTLDEEFVEDDFELFVGEEKPGVTFNSVSIPTWDEDLLRIIAQVLAQSGSLSLLESEVASMVERSETLTCTLTDSAFPYRSRKKLLEFLGGALRARHQIVNQLLILKDPEIVWENEDAFGLYKMLLDNFEFSRRIESIEKMLDITYATSELHFDLFNARHSELLEIVIILLIAVEIVQTFVGH